MEFLFLYLGPRYGETKAFINLLVLSLVHIGTSAGNGASNGDLCPNAVYREMKDACSNVFSERTGSFIRLTPKYVPLDHPNYDVLVPREARRMTNYYCARPACVPNPCGNCGNCSETLVDFECHCSRNFTGKTCFVAQCPEGWSMRYSESESCYLYQSDTLSWTSARDSCVQLGGYLAAIQTPKEITSVREYLTSIFVDQWVWIGLNDRVSEGTFTWTGFGGALPLSSSLWNPGEPNDALNEDCIVTNGHNLNDEACHDLHHYLCELHL